MVLAVNTSRSQTVVGTVRAGRPSRAGVSVTVTVRALPRSFILIATVAASGPLNWASAVSLQFIVTVVRPSVSAISFIRVKKVIIPVCRRISRLVTTSFSSVKDTYPMCCLTRLVRWGRV